MLRNSCLIVSLMLLGALIFSTLHDYRPSKRKETWIPMFSVCIILLALAVLLLTALPLALAEEEKQEGEPMTLKEMIGFNPDEWPKTMYVYTENRGK